MLPRHERANGGVPISEMKPISLPKLNGGGGSEGPIRQKKGMSWYGYGTFLVHEKTLVDPKRNVQGKKKKILEVRRGAWENVEKKSSPEGEQSWTEGKNLMATDQESVLSQQKGRQLDMQSRA